jgi:replicative DNA helicase
MLPMDEPHDVGIEGALLGALLVDNAVLHRLGRLNADSFFDGLHAQIFEAIRLEISKNRVATPVTLAPIFAGYPEIVPGLSVKAYLGRLATQATSLANAPSYAESICDFARRRKLIDAARQLDAAARQMTVETPVATMAAVEVLNDVLAEGRQRKTRSSFYDATSELIDGMVNDDGGSRLTTGITSLEKITGGWRRGQLALLAGRPSMGKSTVGVAMALASAKRDIGTAIFSLEMSRPEIAARMCSDLTWEPRDRIEYAAGLGGKLNDQQVYRWAQAAQSQCNLPLQIDDQAGLTIAEISARTKQISNEMARKGKTLGIVMVDHLGLVKASNRYSGNKVNETGEISAALKQLAKDHNVAVIALSQLSRGTEGRENKRPTLSDLRNSGDLEQDADLVMFTYRESYYLERMRHDPGTQKEMERQSLLEGTRNSLDILVAKNRNGPTDNITLFADMGCNVVRDAA